MTKTYSLHYKEVFGDHHWPEWREENFFSEEDLRAALNKLSTVWNIKDIQVSVHFNFEDFNEIELDK